MYSTCDELTIATRELYCYLEQQVNAIAPEIPALVPAKIQLERVGFTRNASNTPYIVYWVKGRRCCTFIARRIFLDLVQVLLKFVKGIEDKICSVRSSEYGGLWVATPHKREYIPDAYINHFLGRYNQIALEHVMPQAQCKCLDMFDMCLHRVAELFRPCLEDVCSASNQSATGYYS